MIRVLGLKSPGELLCLRSRHATSVPARVSSIAVAHRDTLGDQLLDRGQIEVAVVGAEALGHERRRRAAERGSVTALAP
jgi:hypothetical protein